MSWLSLDSLEEQDLADDLAKIYGPLYGDAINIWIIQTIYNAYPCQYTINEINA